MEPISFVEARTLYCADNLEQLVDFPSECVDLIYLDPPFFSNQFYEVIWGDEAEVRSFEDRWEGGVQVYVNWMRERMFELHRVLKSTGSIYLHCDWHAGHYLKTMMDDVFGIPNFRNEIIWHYGGRGAKAVSGQYPRNHDVLFWYSKDSEWTYEKQYTTAWLTPEEAREAGYRQDEKSRWFKTAPRGDYTDASIKRLRGEERIHDTRTGGIRIKYFLEEGTDGQVLERKLIGDVWNDIPDAMHLPRGERLGYPTQKPEALLERVIRTSTTEGDLVLDPFCGCGTAIAVAERLKRQWIGIDISPTAVGLMKRRVAKLGVSEVRVVGVPMTVDELRLLKPFEFQNWVMQRLNGTHSARKTGDMGIDGFSFMVHDPIQVKQSEKVGRKVIDEFETAIERAKKRKGYVIAFSFTKPAYEEAARAKTQKGIEIRLIKVADLLGPEDQPDVQSPELSDIFPAEQISFLDLPLPEARNKKARPTPGELIESDRENAQDG
jgi:DNA modification methylase